MGLEAFTIIIQQKNRKWQANQQYKSKTSNLAIHQIKIRMFGTDKSADFVIVGTGLVGATYARKIRECNKNASILMIDAGAQGSKLPGENAKNFYLYNSFEEGLNTLSHKARAEMVPVSIAPNISYPEYLPPSSQTKTSCNYAMNRGNPLQKPEFAMPAALSSFQVGGRSGLWGCCTPRPTKTEMISPELIPEAEMKELLDETEKLYFTNQKAFEGSMRGQSVLKIVNQFFEEHKNLIDENRKPAMLPLAVRRIEGQQMVHWTATDTILGPELLEEWKRSEYAPNLEHKFQILAETLAVQLEYSVAGQGIKKVDRLLAKDLKTGKQFIINGKVFIICANPINTPQLLHYSKIRPQALGRYLNEQSTLFCQIVLKNEIIEEIEAKKMKSNVKNCCQDAKYQKFCVCKDSFPILSDDPIPNVWIPNSEKFPFHVQLHRDSYPYGILPENMGIDHRTVLDVRFFAKTQAKKENRVFFQEEGDERKCYDMYGMPQPIIHFERSEKDGMLIDMGMKYMQNIASRLGSYLKGVEPMVMPRGTSQHFMGTTRIGKSEEDSTCDVNSLVWGCSNLYVGGSGNIPTELAGNPSLVCSALAIKSVKSMMMKKTLVK